ncbi:P-loop containing nucleoside triphosphate hydrolase protein [Podospora conica]|nr:P-loop containing nucleoside triphosphate hydrolase protein [Schizothecium conicum]
MANIPSPSMEITFPVHSTDTIENVNFIGRDQELHHLHRLLIDGRNETKPAVCSLNGNPGAGKTQIANKFFYMYHAEFDARFWVSADPRFPTETLRAFSNIARCLGLPHSGETIQESELDNVLRWLELTDKRWLLVFDNVVDFKNIARYWPKASRGHSAIIVTSQANTGPWIPASHQIAVNYLDDAAGSDFLCGLISSHRFPQPSFSAEDRQTASQISHELGGSPLYLTQAQGLLHNTSFTLPEYLELIQKKSLIPTATMHRNGTNPTALEATHDRLIESLDPGAVKLLHMLSFLYSEHVGEELFISNQHGNSTLDFMPDKSTYNVFISQLCDSQLVQQNGTGTQQRHLTMHQATRKAMHLRLNKHPEERQAALDRVARLLRSHYPAPSPLQIANREAWPRLMTVLPHIISAVDAFERASPPMSGSLFLAQLVCDVGGMDLCDRGMISEAYRLNRCVEAMLDSLHCPQDIPLRGQALAIMGLCTDSMAIIKRREGLEMRRKCLSIRHRCFDATAPEDRTQEDGIRLYNSYTDLVCSLQQINDFEGVRANLAQCLAQYRAWGPEDDTSLAYEYAKYYNQMAYVLLWETQEDDAVAHAKKAYVLVEKAAPGTGIARLYQADYAHILFQCGNREDARNILESLLDTSEVECGKENLRTLEISLNVAIMDVLMGNSVKARSRLEYVITMSDKISGWPRENTVRGQYYLSQALLHQAASDNNLPGRVEGLNMQETARKELDLLLALDDTEIASRCQGDLSILFDYLVHWENRLVTPRKVGN